jgi:uncharacterized protein (DUF2235 family)
VDREVSIVGKNIVVCCDGTANEFAADNTNVVKLYSVLVHDRPDQCTYYHPGIGTMEPPGALTPLRRRLTRAMGLAFGAYLENDIRDAYAFLMQNYQDGDKVYLFGFSRGAYTVRAVASLLRMYGLMRAGNESTVPYATRMMMAITKARRTDRERYQQKIEEYFDLAKSFKATMARPCAPFFVGVWDTVSSVGWIDNPLKLPYSADNGDIAIGRHAIALDEKRAFFRTNLWRRNADPAETHGPVDELQVWFPGVHCDVGGGYPEAESALSKLTLEWMLDEAEPHGLKVDPAKRRAVLGGVPPNVAPDPRGQMHESLAGLWKLAEYVPKKRFDFATRREEWAANRFQRRTVPHGAVIHWSVYARGPEYVATLDLPPDVTVCARRNTQPDGAASPPPFVTLENPQ